MILLYWFALAIWYSLVVVITGNVIVLTLALVRVMASAAINTVSITKKEQAQ